MQEETLIRFADVVVDPARRSVRRGNKTVRLGKLSYEFLLLLIESAPAVISQEEIGEKLWQGRVATPDTIRQRAKLLRKALGDQADHPKYVEVLHGQGYRLIPEVEQVSQSETSGPGRARMPPRYAGFATAAIAVALIAWLQLNRVSIDENPVSEPAEKSLAVLPFENLTGEPDDAYFVDGFHNDLLTQLSKISRFKVISRTSVLGYRDGERNLREIATELDVENVLEGSVQRSGNTVRINAQLIDARSDAHLWAERYDRELSAENLFEIQGEMAASVAGALQAILSKSEIERLSNPPTTNTKAYNHYLLGNHYLRDSSNGAAHERAAGEYLKAVNEDPMFAKAWALLGRAHGAVYFFMDRSDARAETAKAAVDRALTIDPDLAEAHFALGYYNYHVLGDYEAALAEWEIAEVKMPGDASIFQARGYVYGRMGEWQKSLDNLDKAINFDPRNIENLANKAYTLARFRNYDESELVYRRIVEIEPDHPLGHAASANIALWRDGDVELSRELLNAAPNPFRPPNLQWLQEIYDRDFDAALAVIDSWQAEVQPSQKSYRPKSLYLAVTKTLAGRGSEIDEDLKQAKSVLEERLAKAPRDWRAHIALAEVYAMTGDDSRSRAYMQSATTELPIATDAALGPHLNLATIFVYIAMGDTGTALAHLEQYLSKPAVWSIDGLAADPRFDLLRGHPKFERLRGQQHASLLQVTGGLP